MPIDAYFFVERILDEFAPEQCKLHTRVFLRVRLCTAGLDEENRMMVLRCLENLLRKDRLILRRAIFRALEKENAIRRRA
jgi:hypothetical protein